MTNGFRRQSLGTDWSFGVSHSRETDQEDALRYQEVSSTITRGGKPCCKGGHTVSRQEGGLYQPDVPCPKVRRLMPPSNRLEFTEQVCDYSSFQNRINQDSKEVKAGGRLANQASNLLILYTG